MQPLVIKYGSTTITKVQETRQRCFNIESNSQAMHKIEWYSFIIHGQFWVPFLVSPDSLHQYKCVLAGENGWLLTEPIFNVGLALDIFFCKGRFLLHMDWILYQKRYHRLISLYQTLQKLLFFIVVTIANLISKFLVHLYVTL